MNSVVVQSEHMANETHHIPEVGEGVGQDKTKELVGNVSEDQQTNVNNESETSILNELLSDNDKYTNVSSPPKEVVSEDKTSVQGQFGWTQFDDIFIPYLMRSEDKYVSVDMVQSKIFFKYTRYFSRELYSCGLIEKFHMSSTEAKLLIEINLIHCDNYFGSKLYTTKDYIIKLTDTIEMYEFLNFCYNKLIKKETNIDKRCGFIDIDNSCVPYVWFKNKQCVPIFYFDGQCKYLDEQAIQLKGFDVTYLKLLCKIQGLKKQFFEIGTIPVVDVEYVRKLFPPNTLFKECWPTNYCIKSLLNNSTVDDLNALKKNNQENIENQTVDQALHQNQIVGQESRQTVGQLLENQKQQPTSHLPQIQNLQPTAQLQQKQIMQPAKQLQQHSASSQISKMKNGHINSATYQPYPTKPIKPTQNLLRPSQNTQASKQSRTGTVEIRFMLTENVTVLNSDLEKGLTSIKPNMVQIPDYAPSKNICYFLVRSQIEDKYLYHCTNIDPFRKNVIIATLEEVSQVFKIPLNTLKQVIGDLRINIYWPNKEQLRLLSLCKRYPNNGLIIVQEFMDHLPKIRSIVRGIKCKSS